MDDAMWLKDAPLYIMLAHYAIKEIAAAIRDRKVVIVHTDGKDDDSKDSDKDS